MPDPADQPTKNRSGLVLFAIYCVFYASFIGLSTFSPRTMALRPFGGVNLAIIYGFALIAIALLLACIYMWRCRNEVEQIEDLTT